MSDGMIYLIQPAELVGTNRYKIGFSKEPNLSRCNKGYSKGSRYLYIGEHQNAKKLESKIIEIFNQKFKLISGREYFEGNEQDMKNELLKIIRDFENKKIENINNIKKIIDDYILEIFAGININSENSFIKIIKDRQDYKLLILTYTKKNIETAKKELIGKNNLNKIRNIIHNIFIKTEEIDNDVPFSFPFQLLKNKKLILNTVYDYNQIFNIIDNNNTKLNIAFYDELLKFYKIKPIKISHLNLEGLLYSNLLLNNNLFCVINDDIEILNNLNNLEAIELIINDFLCDIDHKNIFFSIFKIDDYFYWSECV